MIRYFFVLFLVSIELVSFSQKAKDKGVSFKFLKAPLTPKALPKNYTFTVTEKYNNEKGVATSVTVKSKTLAYDPKSNFYKGSSGLGHINGFNDIAYHKDSVLFFITMDIGLLDDGLRSVLEGSYNGNKHYQYQIPFRLPIDFKAKYNDTVFYEMNTKDTSFLFHFPKDYKPTESIGAYPSTTQLGAAYETNRIGFLNHVKTQILNKWIYMVKMDFSSHFAKQLTDFKIETYWIKEKKEIQFADANLLVSEMDTLFAQLDRNYEKSYASNWHKEPYHSKFVALSKSWEALLSIDLSTFEVKDTDRFSEEIKWGMIKNWMWCKFFSGDMQSMLDLAIKLEEPRKTDYDLYYNVVFKDMIPVMADYIKRYQANLDLFQN